MQPRGAHCTNPKTLRVRVPLQGEFESVCGTYTGPLDHNNPRKHTYCLVCGTRAMQDTAVPEILRKSNQKLQKEGTELQATVLCHRHAVQGPPIRLHRTQHRLLSTRWTTQVDDGTRSRQATHQVVPGCRSYR